VVFALIAGLLAGTGGSLFAQDRHPVCEAKQHDCGQPAKISSCCCGDVGTSPDAGTPAQSRTELSKDASATLALPQFIQLLPPAPLTLTARTSPPRLCLLDLPTLFASLLI